MTVTLPADLTLRAPISADIQEVAELVRACELTDTGSSDVDAEVIQDTWQNMDLTTNAFVLVNAEGQIVGYTSIKLYGQLLLLDPNSGVRLDYRERGLERYLLQLAEARGRALWAESGKEGIPEVKTWSMTPARRRQLEAQEYTVRSSDMSMVIDLREHPPVFREIAGLEIRRAELSREIRAVHFVIQEAFQDIGGYPYRPFEEWEERVLECPTFDPTMLYVASDEEQVVGAIVCRTFLGTNTGFVWQVAVLRAYRRRGIAEALLQKVFTEYARRDILRIDLNVDQHNTTGAHQLYAGVGMRCAIQIDEMYKTLA